jgi:hypothetical protein
MSGTILMWFPEPSIPIKLGFISQASAGSVTAYAVYLYFREDALSEGNIPSKTEDTLQSLATPAVPPVRLRSGSDSCCSVV